MYPHIFDQLYQILYLFQMLLITCTHIVSKFFQKSNLYTCMCVLLDKEFYKNKFKMIILVQYQL